METPKLKPVPADDVAKDPLAEDDDREPTKEEIMEDLRIALRDVKAGVEGMPAREAIKALKHRVYGDGHEG
ncbi:MAG: hypothetical protein J4G18_16580 [Anaerolineae bacterium]|nr:hypothetical protein [Anaerolineae bacterium]